MVKQVSLSLRAVAHRNEVKYWDMDEHEIRISWYFMSTCGLGGINGQRTWG